jgi:hypothetical protein
VEFSGLNLTGPFPNKPSSGFKQQCYSLEEYRALRSKVVAAVSPEELTSMKADPIASDMAFNKYIYWDVFTGFPQVRSMSQLQ